MYRRVKESALLPFTAQLLYHQFILMMVLWLAVFGPVTCQYHGLLLHFGTGVQSHDLDAIVSEDHVCGDPTPVATKGAADGLTQPDQAAGSPRGIYGHATASTTTMILSLLVLVQPRGLDLPHPATARSFRLSDVDMPPLFGVSPLLQPPKPL
jgi:hypothetical protein